MFRFLLSFCMIATSFLSADDPLGALFPSDPEQMIALESWDELRIGGIINPLSGTPCLKQTDLIARGAQSIPLTRLFHSYYVPLKSKLKPVPSKDGYAGWVYCPHTRLNVFTLHTKRKKEIKACVADSNGVVLLYSIKNGITKLQSESWGICNGLGDSPSGMYDYRNVTIHLPNTLSGAVVVTTPEGIERHYQIIGEEVTTIESRRYSTLSCLLIREILQNGKVLRYRYHQDTKSPIKIESLDPNEQHVYASIDLSCNPKRPLAVFKTNTGLEASFRHSTAQFYEENQIDNPLNLFCPLHITSGKTPFFKEESMKYENKRFRVGKDEKTHACLVSYRGKNHDFMCQIRETLDFSDEIKRKRLSSTQRVQNLMLSGNEQELEEAYSFQYKLSVPGCREGRSKVTHADGSIVEYSINKQMLLASIKYHDPQGLQIKEKQFEWNSNQWLKSIEVKDASGKMVSRKIFEYDLFGNPIVETFEGDLTGNGVDERYKIQREFSQDGRHLLLSERTEEGKQTTYTYVPKTNLIKTKEIKEGQTLISCEIREYDDCLNLIKVIEEDSVGKAKRITAYILKDSQPFLHMPVAIEESYEEEGILHALKRTVLDYDQFGHVCCESIYDANGQFRYRIQKEYDEGSNLLSTTNALGEKTSYMYEKHGWPITETKSNRATHITYDRKGRKKKVQEIGADGVIQTELYRHNHQDCLIKKTDTFNLDTIYSYDCFQNEPSTIISPSLYNEVPVVKTFVYDALGRCTSSTDPRKNRTQTTYNAYGSPVEVLYADQSKESFRYTKSGRIASYTNPNGLTTRYVYDGLGRVRTKFYEFKQECLNQETFVYEGLRLKSWSDQEQRVTEYTYDGAGRKVREVFAGRVSKLAYDALGRLAAITEENGEVSLVTRYEYDELDRKTAKICQDVLENVLTRTDYTYDVDGNVVSISKDINGQRALESFSYDSQKRLVRSQDPLGLVTSTNYDETYRNSYGQCVQQKRIEQPNRTATIETSDPYGRIARRERLDSSGEIISAEDNHYDACGNLSLKTEHVYLGSQYLHSKCTAYAYDEMNRLKSFTRAFQTSQERKTSYSYYFGDRIKTKEKPDGTILTYEYDPFGYQTGLVSSDGTIRHAFSYNSLGHLKKVTDELSRIEISRRTDPFGNVLQETFSPDIVISKTYDSLNRPLEVTLPDSSKIRYTYDPLFCQSVGRLTSSNEELYKHRYENYDLSGYLTHETLIKNADSIHYATDLKGRIASVKGSYFRQECHYDDVDNLTGLTTDQQEASYAYDSLNQIQEEKDEEKTLFYTHDSARNRIKEGQEERVYNALDELEQSESETYTYDRNGNLCRRDSFQGSVDYHYDALNRLIEVVENDTKIAFTYDPLGRKLIKHKYQLVEDRWERVSQVRYLYDGFHDIGSLDTDGNIQELRILGRATPLIPRTVALELNGTTYAPIHDNQGNIRRLIESDSADIVSRNDFSSFGEVLLAEGIFNPWRYSEKRFDPDLNLIDFGKRFYSPSLGRWLTTDPVGFVDGMNLYTYARNNPFRYMDPDGRFAFVIPLLSIAFGAEGAVIAALAVETITYSLLAGAIGCGINEALIAFSRDVDNRRYNPHVAQEANEEEKPKKKSSRTDPIDLEEQLALEEAKGVEGEKVKSKQNDPNYPPSEWQKKSHSHDHPDGTKTEVHWWENIETGEKHGYKLKDADNAKSRNSVN